jgi:hypothetical protein
MIEVVVPTQFRFTFKFRVLNDECFKYSKPVHFLESIIGYDRMTSPCAIFRPTITKEDITENKKYGEKYFKLPQFEIPFLNKNELIGHCFDISLTLDNFQIMFFRIQISKWLETSFEYLGMKMEVY